jgi:hypothetical protein
MQQAVATFSNAAARTAAITSPIEGQLTYLQDVKRYQSWNGTSWSSPDDLTLILSQTIGTAVSSVTVSNAFSSTYDNYKILISGGASSTTNVLFLRLGNPGNNHFGALITAPFAGGSVSATACNNQAAWNNSGNATTSGISMHTELQSPFLSTFTRCQSIYADTNATTGTFSGIFNASTSFTDFTILTSTGTLTGGTISVYGYRKTA